MMLVQFLIPLICAAKAYNTDEIHSLPGLDFGIDFRQYSGYLNATNGKFLHYWFVESQHSPTSDPLVLWMNGGPGCSSLDGLLTELGPFHVNQDGKTLYNNPFSWNKVANVIFLEAPAGVGFSYSLSQNYTTDDDTVSKDNYLALQHFFEKFPQFKKNDFYITGESYGGIYVPTLSVRVLTGPANIKFKGFAIGNGWLNIANLTNSIVFFGYYHGLIGPALWEQLSKYCCDGPPSQNTCNFVNSQVSQCLDATQKFTNILSSGFNIYNLYDDCVHDAAKSSRYSVDKRNVLAMFLKENSLFHKLSDAPPCVNASNITQYLNQRSVRTALHIPNFVQSWEICSAKIEDDYERVYNTMRPQILQLLNSGKLRGLIYNGDVDMACNFLGDEWFTSNLNLPIIKNYDTWKYNDQIAGFVKYYKNLSFLTVKGSGHMVPQDKPGQALKMITSFLSDKPY